MPSHAEQQILTLLDKKQGSVEAVAQALGVSTSYISRIKRRLWVQPDNALLPVRQPETPDEVIKALLPPNVDATQKLRDTALEKLQELVENNQADAKLLAKIIQTCWKYEGSLRAVAQPAINVIDNRKQVFQATLVDSLGKLSVEALRALSGVPEPITHNIIDITPGKEEEWQS